MGDGNYSGSGNQASSLWLSNVHIESQSLSPLSQLPFSPFFLFFSHCLSNCLSFCLILSKKQHSGRDQIQWQSHQQLHPSSSLVQCIYSLSSFFQLLWDLFLSVFLVTELSKLLFCPCLTSVAPHVCFSVMSVWLRPYVALSHTEDTTEWTFEGHENLFSQSL